MANFKAEYCFDEKTFAYNWFVVLFIILLSLHNYIFVIISLS